MSYWLRTPHSGLRAPGCKRYGESYALGAASDALRATHSGLRVASDTVRATHPGLQAMRCELHTPASALQAIR
ncbi:hypothetical protein BVI1335_540016 [Burkholderia vietnamiensis]|nr:hypothetical protein BVI1335_540016 [Burkholderia vietnamiensis]